MKVIVISLLIACVLLLVIFLFFYWIHPRFLFYPEKLPADYRFSFQENFDEVFLHSPGQAGVHALHFRVHKPKGVVLYFHGNAGSLKDWGTIAPDFLSRSYDLFIMDYRGYGKSTGTLSEKTLLTDALNCYAYLQKQYNSQTIIVYGRSIGTGPAAFVASQHKPAGLVLETPYYSMARLVQSYVPWLPVAWLVRYPLPTAQWAKKATCPIYLIHGTNDEIIPFASSLLIAKEVPAAKLFRVEGGAHNNLSSFSLYDVFLDVVLN